MKCKKTISIVLSILMLFTMTPVFGFANTGVSGGTVQAAELSADEYTSVSPSKVTDAIGKYTDAVGKFVEDTSTMTQFASLVVRFGGLASIASGAVSMLQVMGIIQDPALKGIAQIKTEVQNIQDQLHEMDMKLDDISKELINLAVTVEEKDRQNNAERLLTAWNDFDTNYCEPLDDLINEYQGMINQGIKSWWSNGTRTGVIVTYTATKEEPVTLTYYKGAYENGIPATSDNGETVLQDESFGVPAELISDTTDFTFNIDTYIDDFRAAFVETFIPAANDKKILASDAFYNAWAQLSDKKKSQKADEYAYAVLNLITYKITTEVMSDNDLWVIKVKNAYTNYCKNVTKHNSGVDALINAQYLTHGFEGEIKEDLETIGDSMIAAAGFYGQFALNCVCQDSMQSAEEKEALQELWADTILKLDEKKKASLTGMDNYCYLVGGIVNFDTPVAYSQIGAQYTETASYNRRYDSCTPYPWKIVDETDIERSLPVCLDDITAQILYHQYLRQKTKDQTFVSFLRKHGVNVPKDFDGVFTTKCGTSQTFSLTDAIPMKATSIIGDYFSNNNEYRINKGNDSSVEGDCFIFHDKIPYNNLDPKTGQLEVNDILCARAAYCETHWNWYIDEIHLFQYGCDSSYRRAAASERSFICTQTNRAKMNMLAVNPLKSNLSDDSPLNAFDCIHVTCPEYSIENVTVGGIEDKPYTGQEITQTPTVNIDGETLTEGNDYTVSYENNIEPGIATMNIDIVYPYPATVKKNFDITKLDNTLALEAGTTTVKYKKLKKKARKIPASKVITITDPGQGALKYKLSSARKEGMNYRTAFKVKAKTGKITVKKKTAKGLYELTINVTAAGDKHHNKVTIPATIVICVK